MKTAIQLKQKTMRRIYMVYGLRLVLHPRTLKSVLLLVLLWRSTTYISYANVFQNAPSMLDIGRNIDFIWSSVSRTELTSLMILSISTLVAILLFRDFFRQRVSYI